MQNLILKINFYFARYVIYNIHCKIQSSSFQKANLLTHYYFFFQTYTCSSDKCTLQYEYLLMKVHSYILLYTQHIGPIPYDLCMKKHGVTLIKLRYFYIKCLRVIQLVIKMFRYTIIQIKLAIFITIFSKLMFQIQCFLNTAQL